MRPLHFHEHQKRENVQLTRSEVEALRTRFRCVVIRADTGDDLYVVHPKEWVGAALVGDTAIVVEPKLSIARVLFLIAHAVDPAWTDDATLATATSLTDAVTALFTHLCDRAVHSGLLRSYSNRNERLYTVRGRIDFAEQLRRSPGRDLPLSVSYQEHDEDILENRILLAALDMLAAIPTYSTTTFRSLIRLRQMLEGVSLIQRDHLVMPTVQWTRLNEHYRPAIELAQLILSGSEADLGTGGVKTPGFVVRMSAVFENFVRAATRRALGVDEQEFPAGPASPKLYLDARERLNVQPDLSRWIDGRCRFVGELKYRLDTGHGNARHLHQTLAYAIAAGLPDATLVYADGSETGTTHQLPQATTRIHVRHLDLNTGTDQLLGQIQTLADHVDQLTALEISSSRSPAKSPPP